MTLSSGYYLMSGEIINQALFEALIVPTSDPFIAGVLWNNNGIANFSFGPMPVLTSALPSTVTVAPNPNAPAYAATYGCTLPHGVDYTGPLFRCAFTDTSQQASGIGTEIGWWTANNNPNLGGVTGTVTGANGVFTVSGTIYANSITTGNWIVFTAYETTNNQLQATIGVLITAH